MAVELRAAYIGYRGALLARKYQIVGILALLAVTPSMAEQRTINGKPDFSGTWKAESNDSVTWNIEQTADSISIREIGEDKKANTEVRCNTKGADCAGRVDGDEVTVAFYYNGPALVETVRRGSSVDRVRRTISDDGQRMTVEVIPLLPAGKPHTTVLIRAEPKK
jgi:hypothetical protein